MNILDVVTLEKNSVVEKLIVATSRIDQNLANRQLTGEIRGRPDASGYPRACSRSYRISKNVLRRKAYRVPNESLKSRIKFLHFWFVLHEGHTHVSFVHLNTIAVLLSPRGMQNLD